MRISNVSLTAFRGVSANLDLPFDKDGKNLLVYGENGSAKSSFARALEFLFNPKAQPEQGLLAHRNLFVPTMPEIRVDFTGRKGGVRHDEPVICSNASGKPTPAWLLSSAARSAFLDHRKLLMLSDRTHGNLSQRFFQTAVQHLFGNLPAGTSGETVSSLWSQIQADTQAYREAKDSSSSSDSDSSSAEADSGVADAVAHHKPIEDAVNQLNQTLDDYLLPRGSKAPMLVTETERLMKRFEGHGLTIALGFDHLTFNRTDGSFGGGALRPEVTYCKKPLGVKVGDIWESTHHEVLNEARLTALALALFFAAVRLQDQIPYIAGATDPEQPARLLVLDDILIGLDYSHRIPVLEILAEEFAKDGHFQVVLLTHDRVWFDVCRLQLEPREWKTEELYAKCGAGPDKPDFPVRKQSAADYADRAKQFLDEHELPAAANYARTSIETSLKRICDRRHTPISFSLNPDGLKIDLFIDAAFKEPMTVGSGVASGTHMLLPQRLQKAIKALRSTVLNPLSHAHPTSVTSSEVNRAIDVARELEKIARSLKKEPSALSEASHERR